MKIIYDGFNSEDMLGKKKRRITKYVDKDLFYTKIHGEKNVSVEFMDTKVCEQGEKINFVNRYEISIEDFNKKFKELKE